MIRRFYIEDELSLNDDESHVIIVNLKAWKKNAYYDMLFNQEYHNFSINIKSENFELQNSKEYIISTTSQ